MQGGQQEQDWGLCRNVDEFQKLCRIGVGTYGTVYRARDLRSNETVALKRVILHNEKHDGFPITALREIKLLKRLAHPHCVSLLDVVVNRKRGVFLVFEYADNDLAALVDAMAGEKLRPFNEAEVKQLLLQLLDAISFLHANWIVHRDVKMSNLLYDNRGVLKLCDFGLAREYASPLAPMTPKVVTLWYRAPELLLGATEYGPAVDVWSTGCVFGELLLRRPLAAGSTALEQLRALCDVLGTPSERIWPGFGALPHTSKLSFDPVRYRYNRLPEVFPLISPQHGIGLMNELLTFDPMQRCTAASALSHPYFSENPVPVQPGVMPTFPSLQNAQ